MKNAAPVSCDWGAFVVSTAVLEGHPASQIIKVAVESTKPTYENERGSICTRSSPYAYVIAKTRVAWVVVESMRSTHAHKFGPACRRRLCRLEHATLARIHLEELLLAPNQSFH